MASQRHHAELLAALSPCQLSSAELLNIIAAENQGQRTKQGSWNFLTGARTARSPNDRFICCDDITRDTVDWGAINRPIEPEIFTRLWRKAVDYLASKQVYQADLQVGASAKYGLPVTVLAEHAWQCLFAHYLFITPTEALRAKDNARWSVLAVPGLTTDPEQDGVNSDAAVMINFTQRQVLLVGMHYAGEIKKSMFSVQNFLLAEQGVLSMHCAANQGENGETALFFGLSGTGKTTLSADPARALIGDDEHGWSEDEGIFNLEGGCYAKTINLGQDTEPVIYGAIREGTILENVVIDPKTAEPIYSDSSITQNSRAAYPREFVEKRVHSNGGPHPRHVIFLTCDLYGVLPPVAKLSHKQAIYYFLSGYTALVGATEIGQGQAVKSTFSACFGAPFFPRSPLVYGRLLEQRLQHGGANVYLVNTGWTGGGYGVGERFKIPTTRRIVSAILSAQLDHQDTQLMPLFNLQTPSAIAGIDTALLQPRQCWEDKKAYDLQAETLAREFIENFKRYDMAQEYALAGPQLD